MASSNSYEDELRRIKSLLIVTSLQKRRDLRALKRIKDFNQPIEWKPIQDLMIEQETWKYVVIDKNYDSKLVFCHPEILISDPRNSLYYRGLSGLSLKAVQQYCGSVDALESGKNKKLPQEKALRMAQIYNTFVCSIIENSTNWTLENGYRTIIATMGISLDGSMRNRIGQIAEERVRSLVLEWLAEKDLIKNPIINDSDLIESYPRTCELKKHMVMHFGSEPDISFLCKDELLAADP